MLSASCGSRTPFRDEQRKTLVRALIVLTSALLSVQPAVASPLAQVQDLTLLTRSISEKDHVKFLHIDVPNFIKNQGFGFTWVEDLHLAQLKSPERSVGGWSPSTLDRVTFLLRIDDVQDKHTLRYKFSLERVRTEQFSPFEKKWREVKAADPKDDTPTQLQNEILEKLRQEFIG